MSRNVQVPKLLMTIDERQTCELAPSWDKPKCGIVPYLVLPYFLPHIILYCIPCGGDYCAGWCTVQLCHEAREQKKIWC